MIAFATYRLRGNRCEIDWAEGGVFRTSNAKYGGGLAAKKEGGRSGPFRGHTPKTHVLSHPHR